MPQIIVFSDPQPEVQEPRFVKEAYVGLVLTPKFAFEPEEGRRPYPQGTHMVPLGEFLRAMCLHDYRAYQWHAAHWGDIQDIVKAHNDEGLLLPFPFDCCQIRGVVH